jgi:hypothetical protein
LWLGFCEREGRNEMTPQEQEMIGDLIDRVQKTQLAEKDMDAEQMLQEGMGKNPDALYILAQTVLVQKYALDQAQAQLTHAKAQIEQMQQHPEPRHATSFLGSLLGRSDAPAPPPPPQVYSAPPQGYAPQPVQGYPQYGPMGGYPPQYGPPMGMGGGGGGFMRGALQTAAGVAAGALAFEGVESLMHGFGHAAGYGPGSGFGGFDGGQRPTEEIVNNYYGDDRGDRGGHDFASGSERMEGGREDRDFGGRDDRGGLERASYNDGGGNLDTASYNDNGSDLDTASVDDNGSNVEDASFDDGGGGFDDGGGSSSGDDGSFA